MSITKVAFQDRHPGERYRGIGLVEVVWKICVSIVKNRLRITIILHDALHGFRRRRGIETASMEKKLEQKLAGIVHEPLFQVSIDAQK